jgi:SpoVK/Ycf46/Vps4 family AAA+-type ATPase
MMNTAIHEPAATPMDPGREQLLAAMQQIRAALGAMSTPEAAESDAGNAQDAPIMELAQRFGLSQFEMDVLLLCAAAELHPEIPALCAAVQGDERLRYPTFQLLLSSFPDANWNALKPGAALRHWKLVEAAQAESLSSAQLRIEEPVLYALLGSPSLDERLQPLLDPIDPPLVLPASYRAQAEKLAALWSTAPRTHIAHLQGTAAKGKRSLAAAACAALGLRLYSLRIAQLPAVAADRELIIRLLERDAALCGFALLLDMEDSGPSDWLAASSIADRFQGTAMICGSARTGLRMRNVVSFAIDRPSPGDQRALWAFALGEHAARFNGELDRVATQYSFDCESILSAGQQVRERLQAGETEGLSPGELLLEVCRADSRPELDSLAQRIEVRAGWESIVLPEATLETLHAIAAQVRQQGKVLERWGFAAQTARGLGISALFHGQSGTGKTLAAEVLAHELKLDLFRIDLSQMVSKYVGETEKNLRAVFDAAEHTGSVLLFDEADALFGKRSEVRDSHDRYANIEVSYLLQRMEAYRGLAILTTNLRAGMDTAFLRRIRFFVSFPFPDQGLRRRIWERMFPSSMPAERLDFDKLSRLNLAGGSIRNIALNAAYIAADRNEPVRMAHLLVAARRECAKLERSLSEAEVGGWA